MATETDKSKLEGMGEYKYGFSQPEDYVFKSRKGLSRDVVQEISWMKGEPAWMTQFRLKALDHYEKRPMPTWGGDLSQLDMDEIYFYIKPSDKPTTSWDQVPDDIKRTFDKLGIPEAERKFLAGSGAQYECLSGDTRVYTARGLVPIREIRPGDTVFSLDEQADALIPSQVKATEEKGERQVFEVQVGTRAIRATTNHPFLVLDYARAPGKQRGHYTRKWKYLSELKPGDLVAVAKSLPDTGQPYTLTQPEIRTVTIAIHTNEQFGFAKIGSISPAGVETVYDIEVNGPHNFVAEGLIVHNSEVIYHNIQESLTKQGVIFLSSDDGLKQHPDIFKKYFSTIVPPTDNKFAALNSAVWSGGSFLYVPEGVHVELPLQAYFRVNAQSMGQFERTLIIVEKGAYVHYIEGCTAPIYSSDSFHSGVIEIIVKEGARMRYSTIQNWSTNMYNLVTQRSVVSRDATMEWVDANLGCLGQGSTVTTPEGIKPIEKLEVGDKVLSYDEPSGQLCFRHVLAKRFSGHQSVRTVSVGERKLRVTANHPFYSYAYDADAPKKLGRYRFAYVRADHLEKAIVPCGSLDYGKPHRLLKPVLVTEFNSRNQYADGLVMTRELQPRMANMEYTTDDVLWLFGYWLGDGDIQVKEGKTEDVIRWAKVGFSTPVTDRARDRLMSTMTAVINAPPVERADGVHVSWHSKELAEYFRINGFAGGARDKRVPPWVWSLPESQRLAFIAGYLDADGYAQKPRRLALKSVNRALLEDVASLLVTLGITSRLYTEFDEPKRVTIMGVECVAHGAHRLIFPQDERLLSYLSPALRQHAEASPPAQLEHHRSIGRSNIELPDAVEAVAVKVSDPSAETVPTWDIEVEGTGNFISQGFIVHNSKLTMKYPSVYMMEPGAKGEILSIAFAGKGQHQDAGGKVVHVAPHTRSKITSKSISKDGGRASYRGLLKVYKGAEGSQSHVQCDALLLDERSRTDTYPYIEVDEDKVTIGHEATVSKIGDEQLFYLMSRGLNEVDARTMVVSGFIEPLVKELPMEYAVEMNRLIQLQMEGSVG